MTKKDGQFSDKNSSYFALYIFQQKRHSVGNTFEPTYLRQQAPVGTSQDSTSPIHLPTMDEQSLSQLSLSRETKLKELKRLAYKYPQFHNNGPDEIVGYAAYWSINGDDTILDELLEQLCSIDRLANLRF